MSKRSKKVLIILIPLLVMLGLGFALFTNALNAGTWEDNPKNWFRAFHEDQPADVKVVHSKYWKSNHFTHEYAYFFEIDATSEWKDAFLKKQNLVPVPPSVARSFRFNTHFDMTPDWFAPDPVTKYDAYDVNGFGLVWIDKTTGHIHFYDFQL